jgi:hypothetical protein
VQAVLSLSGQAAEKSVGSKYYVRRALPGGRAGTHGPFGNLYLAIAKGRDLVKAYPTATVTIEDGAGFLVLDGDFLREKYQSK